MLQLKLALQDQFHADSGQVFFYAKVGGGFKMKNTVGDTIGSILFVLDQAFTWKRCSEVEVSTCHSWAAVLVPVNTYKQ